MDRTINYYEALGVERTADDRTIKKAYFALVRKYPPETHPREFQRIREAYDVLTNPDARRAYDATDQFSEHGPQLGGLMKEAVAALDAGDQDRAQAILLSVLEQKPELHAARDLFGLSLLRSQRYDAALVEFNRLVGAQPENHLYLLHRAYVHHARKQYPQALKSYEAALEKAPGDIPTLVSTADCLTSMGMYEQALSHLDRAIHLDGQVDLQDFGMLMRRLEIQLLRNRSDLADQELDRIVQILPPNDADARRYVASRLASLAADMFALQRSADANRLLKKSKQLDPQANTAEFPVRVKLKIDELPEASRQWLLNLAREPDAHTVKRNGYVWPVLATLAGIAWAGVQLLVVLDHTRLWSLELKAALFASCLGAPLLLAFGIQRWRRVAVSPFKQFIGVHPLYLVEVDVDEVTVWPFANLQEVFVTHHSTNGVYTNSVVRLKFPGATTSVSLRGQQSAVDWANHVLARRRRVLELLSSGLLEAEGGVDFLPGEELRAEHARRNAQGKWRPALQLHGAVAAAGVLLFVAAIPFNRWRAEERAFNALAHQRHLRALLDFRAQFPDSRFDDEVKQRIAARYDAAIAELRSKADPSRPGFEALLGLLGTLRDAGTPHVQVAIESTLDRGEGAEDAVDPALVLALGDPATQLERQRVLVGLLGLAFREVVGPELFQLSLRDEARAAQVEAPLQMEVRYTVKVAGPARRAERTRLKLHPLQLDWRLSIAAKGEAEPRYTFEAVSATSDELLDTLVRFAEQDERGSYVTLSGDAHWDFARQLAWDMGVLTPERPDVVAQDEGD